MELQHLEGSLLNLTKKNIQSLVKDTLTMVNEGNTSAIQVLVFARKAKELFEGIEKEIRPLAEDSIQVNKGEKYVLHNVEIVEAETGVKYDYAACKDEEWTMIKEQLDNLNAQLKERETFLKTITKTMTIVNEVTGEISEIHPPVKSGKLGLKLTLK